jgi:hypothetical protein
LIGFSCHPIYYNGILDVFLQEFKQNKFPKELYEVHMFALRCKDPSKACPKVKIDLI